jgi:hypothetical protein
MIDTNAKSWLGPVLLVALATVAGGCGSDSVADETKTKAGETASVAAFPLSENQALKGASWTRRQPTTRST